jgi:hypothetical protein
MRQWALPTRDGAEVPWSVKDHCQGFPYTRSKVPSTNGIDRGKLAGIVDRSLLRHPETGEALKPTMSPADVAQLLGWP